MSNLSHNLIWTCDPAFGVIHSCPCWICILYTRHVAADSDNPSLQTAINERDGKNTIRYLNGVCHGQLFELQEHEHAADIERNNAERDEALEMLAAAEEELLRIKEQLSALHSLFDEVVNQPSPILEPVASAYEEPQRTRTSDYDEEKASVPTVPSQSVLPTPPLTPHSSTLESLPSFQNVVHSVDETFGHVNAQSDSELLSSALNVAGPSQPLEPIHSAPHNLDELLILLEQARAGDTRVWAMLNILYIAAQRTAKADRVPFQQLLLLEWNLRRLPVGVDNGPSTTFPGFGSKDPEIFVDSSGWGVGFIFNGRWLAWELKPGWLADGRDNNWAEMVAVELGLLTITSAGFRSKTVIVRSDNMGVVKSLETGMSNHRRQPEVIERIEEIVERCGIRLEVKWISTKDNPADKPSRGDLPPTALRFPVVVDVPRHLRPFLSSV